MAIEQLKSLMGAIRQIPASAPDGKHEQVSEGKTSIAADLYNLGFNEKKALLEVSSKRCGEEDNATNCWERRLVLKRLYLYR
jgi:hypothetical protein